MGIAKKNTVRCKLRARPFDKPRQPLELVREIAQVGVHELVAARFPDIAAATGLALAALSAAPARGPVLWVARAGLTQEHGLLSGRGLAALGLDPDRLVLVEAEKPAELFWALEEALRSGVPAAVVAEAVELAGDGADFTATRRLSLASAVSGVPALLLMPHGRSGATAAQARWRVKAAPSAPDRHDPRALGRARWSVTLERSRLAPEAVRRCFDLEFDDETLALSVADRLEHRPAAPQPSLQPSRVVDAAGVGRDGWRWAG